VILALEEAIEKGVLEADEVTQDRLEQFLSRSWRRFYKLPNPATEERPRILREKARRFL
jgi:dihydroorotase